MPAKVSRGLMAKHPRSSWYSVQLTLSLLIVAGIVSYLTIHQVTLSQTNNVMQSRKTFITDEHRSTLEQTTTSATSMSVGVATQCHAEANSEYQGEIIKFGNANHKETAGDCCGSCQDTPECNVWAWCGSSSGCGTYEHKECFLKKAPLRAILDDQGRASPTSNFTSGALYRDEDASALKDAETKRLLDMKNNLSFPLVFLDIEIAGEYAGRIEIVLFPDVSPLAAENFRALCTGEKGVAPEGSAGAGKPFSFKGGKFYRIVDRFVNQGGCDTMSIYGSTFNDDPGGLAIKHDRKGLLSMANGGPNSNTCHFFIVMYQSPHLDGKYVIFGEIVSGMEVAEKINALARGKPENSPHAEVVISNAGQIH